jgi:hypothetical protein
MGWVNRGSEILGAGGVGGGLGGAGEAGRVPGELPFTRRLAVQTIRGNGFANGNSQGQVAEVLSRPLPPRACRRIALGAREPY